MHSHMCMIAFHIGTLAETCEGCGIGAKPEDDVWRIHPEDRRTEQVLNEGNARQASFI
jgi:hypothetical protein